METCNLALATKKIYDSHLSLFTLKTLRDILEVRKEATFLSIVKRLVKNKVLIKIEKGRYLLQNSKIHDFVLANFLYRPSYVSFESALNFYGVLSQFPYEVTNATSKKTKQKTFNQKVFSYTHIQKKLFWGYEKKDDFLIAVPEKALLDQLYLASKGLKGIALDEYDYLRLNIEKLKQYLKKFPQTRQFKNMTRNLKKYVRL